jgi:hypothetical protein
VVRLPSGELHVERVGQQRPGHHGADQHPGAERSPGGTPPAGLLDQDSEQEDPEGHRGEEQDLLVDERLVDDEQREDHPVAHRSGRPGQHQHPPPDER